MIKTAITERLKGTGGAKWEIYLKARKLVAEGHDIIEMTIGEPDVGTPVELIDCASKAMNRGRTTYSDGSGEPGLRQALAERYSRTCGRPFSDKTFCASQAHRPVSSMR